MFKENEKFLGRDFQQYSMLETAVGDMLDGLRETGYLEFKCPSALVKKDSHEELLSLTKNLSRYDVFEKFNSNQKTVICIAWWWEGGEAPEWVDNHVICLGVKGILCGKKLNQLEKDLVDLHFPEDQLLLKRHLR